MIFGIAPTAAGASREAVLASYYDAKRLGCTIVHVYVGWAGVQPTDGAHFTWDALDIKAQAALDVGLDILWDPIPNNPLWACATATSPPNDNTDYANLVAALANRYKGAGFHNYEIWGEPDLAAHWYPTPNATDYVALLQETSTALRAEDASAFIISGALYSPWSTAGYFTDMITAGFYNYCDAMGLHPYCTPYWPQDTGNTLNAFRMISAVGAPYSILSKLSTAGVPNFPIWCTEFGITSYNGNLGEGVINRQVQSSTVNYPNPPYRSNQNCGTEDYQAAVVTNVVARLKLISNVAAFFWYRQTDVVAVGSGDWYGLNRTDLTQKPAWQAYATAIAS
jgi:hypothetical protein